MPVILPETSADRPCDFLNILTWVDLSHVVKVSDAPDELMRLLAAVRGALGSEFRQLRHTQVDLRFDALLTERSDVSLSRPVVAERGGTHLVLMAAQDRDLLGGRGVPDAGGLVI